MCKHTVSNLHFGLLLLFIRVDNVKEVISRILMLLASETCDKTQSTDSTDVSPYICMQHSEHMT